MASKPVEGPDCFIIEEDVMRGLRAILARLYAPTPLTADERRDLANAMDAKLSKAIPAESGKLSL